jgi:hypothetical protein
VLYCPRLQTWRRAFPLSVLLVLAAPLAACSPTCPETQTLCGQTCTHVRSDNLHCGRCGNACGEGQVCDEGTCRVSCQPHLTDCGGRCLDLRSDPEHCGVCDRACPVDDTCMLGNCG